MRDFSYETLSEIALVYATKMDPKNKKMFFDKFMDKFVSDMEFLDDETMYKMLWSMISAGRF